MNCFMYVWLVNICEPFCRIPNYHYRQQTTETPGNKPNVVVLIVYLVREVQRALGVSVGKPTSLTRSNVNPVSLKERTLFTLENREKVHIGGVKIILKGGNVWKMVMSYMNIAKMFMETKL